MREVSFVNKLIFNFDGSVTKRALILGDADNDKKNELVCANLQGYLALFKDANPNPFAYANGLGMVTACVVGDVINCGKNYVAVINTEGLLFLFNVVKPDPKSDDLDREGIRDAIAEEQKDSDSSLTNSTGFKLNVFYEQRMPANCKELLYADLDGDGQNEVIIGMTDRVLRTYRWIKVGPDRGKFVGLYKWEFADQIGSVSLNSSRLLNCQDIVVAQPGGTYAKLECFEKKQQSASLDSVSCDSITDRSIIDSDDIQLNPPGSPSSGDHVRTEYINKLTPEYHQLALTQMRNHRISTEVLGGIRDHENSSSYTLIVIATLDGTLMLVNKDEILWSLQVDHQLFALAILETKVKCQQSLTQSDSTCTIVPTLYSDRQEDSLSDIDLKLCQYFVACAWNGKTYIFDEERNYLRFKFDEAVSAFTAGNYHFQGKHHTALVYATFNNQIVLYYDVLLDRIRPMYLLDEVLNNPRNSDLRATLEKLADEMDAAIPRKSQAVCIDSHRDDTEVRIHNLLQDILYSIPDEAIGL